MGKMFRKFLKNTSGNVAMMFSGAVMLTLIGVGAATDLSVMGKKKSSLQGFADAAVLAAAQSGMTDKAALQKLAEEYVLANSMGNEDLVTKLTLTARGTIRVVVSNRHDTLIMGIFGKEYANVSTAAEAPFGSTGPVEISLVLDITGSMDGSKLTSLKSAANGLVDKIDAMGNENFRVSVVPFRDYVNIGTSRSGEPWLYLDYGTGDEDNGNGNTEDYGGGNNSDDDDEDEDEVELNVWNGCAGSRGAPWTTRPYAGPAPVPGAMNINCGQEILPLTNDMAKVRAKIDSLSAKSWTYIPTGLMWGWRTLDPQPPFTEASSISAQNKTSVIILMTDGANTRSQSGSLHEGESTNNANALTSSMCSAVKSDQMQLYTVAYELDDATILGILKQCASTPSMYFDASDAAALTAAFDNIAENLVNIRLSH